MENRLIAALLAAGFSPTPEGLSGATQLTVAESCEVFALCRTAPAGFDMLARAARALRVRMYWLVAGEGVVSSDAILPAKERALLDVAATLDEPRLGLLIAQGRHMAMPPLGPRRNGTRRSRRP